MRADPRLTPARDDLAAASLEGLVPAGRYVRPRRMQVAVPATAVRSQPDASAEQWDQLLLGERFDVLEIRDGFAWGQAVRDGYVGHVGLDALAPEVFAPRASCADAAVDLLGLPYEFWSLGLFAVLGGAAAWTLVRLWAPGGSRQGGPSG